MYNHYYYGSPVIFSTTYDLVNIDRYEGQYTLGENVTNFYKECCDDTSVY